MSPHPDDLSPMAMTATIMGSAIMIIMTVASYTALSIPQSLHPGSKMVVCRAVPFE
jgi:hypothetical protein